MSILRSKKRKKSNNFLPIIDDWENYFQHRDEGWGTTYERLMLHRIFNDINHKYQIKTVLEIPSFGMTGISGINSMWWVKQGKKVTIVDDNYKRAGLIKNVWQESGMNASIITAGYNDIAFNSNSFDLVWNFAALWFVDDLISLLHNLKRLSRQVIFICIPNNKNIFFLLRKLFFAGSVSLNFRNIEAKRIKSEMRDKQWELVDEGFFDIPPWPDIPVKKEVIFSKLKLDFLLNRKESKNRAAGILEYFRGEDKELETRFKKWQFLENSPKIFQRFWAHHRYLIFERI